MHGAPVGEAKELEDLSLYSQKLLSFSRGNSSMIRKSESPPIKDLKKNVEGRK